MDNLDKKLLIHVGAELVIIGGISFWLYNKISSKDAMIEQLQKENRELLLRIQKIENFLQAATGDQYNQAPPEPRNHPHKKKKKKKSQSPTASEEIIESSVEQEIEV